MVGVLAAVAAVLVMAGLNKLARPGPAAADLRSARVPLASKATVRLAAALEATVGVWVIVDGGSRSAAALAVVYLALAAAAQRVRSAAPGSGCGCFGSDAAPVTGIHVSVNLVASAVGVTGALWPPGTLIDAVRADPLIGGALVVVAVVLSGLCRTLLTTRAARRAMVSPR